MEFWTLLNDRTKWINEFYYMSCYNLSREEMEEYYKEAGHNDKRKTDVLSKENYNEDIFDTFPSELDEYVLKIDYGTYCIDEVSGDIDFYKNIRYKEINKNNYVLCDGNVVGLMLTQLVNCDFIGNILFFDAPDTEKCENWVDCVSFYEHNYDTHSEDLISAKFSLVKRCDVPDDAEILAVNTRASFGPDVN